MRRFLKIVIALAVSGSAAYFFRQPIQNDVLPYFSGLVSEIHTALVPCSEPITYSLGTFDPQFGISKPYFLNALSFAEAVWEKPFGRQLFSYAPTGGRLKINLVYDYRQQATSKLQSLGIIVTDDKSSYDALEAKYTALKTEYAVAQVDYEARVQAFDAKKTAYEQQVSDWNTKGGAPRDQYNALEAERLSLQAEAEQLQAMQGQINGMVDEVNALVVVLNRLASSLNLVVDSYNTIGASRGESFEEGLYQSSAAGQEIDIYEFSNRDKLVRVLAHELGHALGLEHVTDPKAIMYKFNQSSNETLTQADLVELKAVCGAK